MPGIVATIQPGVERLDLQSFQGMLARVDHHPWYEKTIWVDPDHHCAVADVRLPALRQDRQPYVSADGEVRIILHGEIYNDDAGSPLRYVHDLYERLGPRCAARLNGSFVLVIIDGRRRQIVVANDRTASRPLFYRLDRQAFHCAPELKALLALPGVSRRLSGPAVASFLSCGYLLAGHTWLEDVSVLDNATAIVFSPTGTEFIKYWDLVFDESGRDRGQRCYQRQLAELIVAAVRRRTRTPHGYGVLLSGGYDSRGILGCVLQTRPAADVATISWGVDEELPHSDCLVAKRLARRVGTRHTFYKLEAERLPEHIREFVYLSDGLTDACLNYPEGLRIFEHIRDELGVEVLLRGDECFGWVSPAFDERTMFQTLGVTSIGDSTAYRRLLGAESLGALGDEVEALMRGLSSKTPLSRIHNRKDFFYLDQRLTHYLHPLNYFKSLEIPVRNPFLDNDILDFVTTLPDRYRIDKGLYRRTIRQMFPAMFTEMAYEADRVDLGAALRRSGATARFLAQTFEPGRGDVDALLRPDGIRRLLEDLQEARAGRLKSSAIRMLAPWPEAYARLRHLYGGLRSRARAHRPMVPAEVVVRRLLTLKIWSEVLLAAP